MPDPQFLSLDSQIFTQNNQKKEQEQSPIKDLMKQDVSTNEESKSGNETTDLMEIAKQIVNIIVQKKPNSPEDFKSLYEEIELTFKNTTIKKIHNESEKNLGASDIIARTDAYLQTIKLLSKKYFHTSENDKANLESLQNRMDNFFGESDEEDSTRQHLVDETKEQIESTVAFKNNLKRYPIKTFDGIGQELAEYCKTISQQYLKTKDLKSFDETQKLLLEIYAARLAQTNQEPELLENLAFDFISDPKTNFEKEIVTAALSILVNKKDGLDELEKEILQKSMTKMGSYEASDEFKEKLSELYKKEVLKIKNEPTETSSKHTSPDGEDDYEEDDDDSSDIEDFDKEQSLTTSKKSTETSSKTQPQTKAKEKNKPEEEFVSDSVIENRKMERLLNEIIPQPYFQVEVIRVPPAQSTQTDEDDTDSSPKATEQNSASSTQTNQQTTESQEAFSETSTYRRKSSKISQPLKARLTLGKELNTAGICTQDYFEKLKKLGKSIKKSCSKGIGEGFLKDLEQFNQHYKSLIKAIERGGANSPLYDDKLMISDNIELTIRKVMRSIIEVYNSPEESEERQETCGKLLRELMGFLRTKEDPEVNEQINRERNLEAAAVDEGIYTMMNAAFTITQGKNQELIKKRLNNSENPNTAAYKAIKKEAKRYESENKGYGKNYDFMKDGDKVETRRVALLTLTRFIGLSLLKSKKKEEITEDLKKSYFDEENLGSLQYIICKKLDENDDKNYTSSTLKVSERLKNDINTLEFPEYKQMSTNIKSALNNFQNLPSFMRYYGKCKDDMRGYFNRSLKNNIVSDFTQLSSLNKIFLIGNSLDFYKT